MPLPVLADVELPTDAQYVIFFAEQLLTVQQDAAIQIIFSHAELQQLPFEIIRHHLVLPATAEHAEYHTVEIKLRGKLPAQFSFKMLRGLITELSAALFDVAGRAFQLLKWDTDHQFCGRCGTVMQFFDHDKAKRCPACHLTNYPRISPAIIVAVHRNDQILLSRAPHFPPNRYSVQAGFVEIGETLEQTVHRELWEEVGIQVKNLCYFGSQAWAFPHSLMIAFTAEYAAGELCLDAQEVEDAAWFSRDDKLPDLPPSQSIAWQLIMTWLSVDSTN